MLSYGKKLQQYKPGRDRWYRLWKRLERRLYLLLYRQLGSRVSGCFPFDILMLQNKHTKVDGISEQLKYETLKHTIYSFIYLFPEFVYNNEDIYLYKFEYYCIIQLTIIPNVSFLSL
jgi:hypothetical protein